ncbi:blue light receptor [Chytridiales sp. JEL 0842]|nr:blue light receptor [Chytridiales sp. JEL 0842]
MRSKSIPARTRKLSLPNGTGDLKHFDGLKYDPSPFVTFSLDYAPADDEMWDVIFADRHPTTTTTTTTDQCTRQPISPPPSSPGSPPQPTPLSLPSSTDSVYSAPTTSSGSSDLGDSRSDAMSATTNQSPAVSHDQTSDTHTPPSASSSPTNALPMTMEEDCKAHPRVSASPAPPVTSVGNAGIATTRAPTFRELAPPRPKAGFDLSVRIHCISSHLLEARIAGPGRRAIRLDDGSIVLPSQVFVKEDKKSKAASKRAALTVPLSVDEDANKLQPKIALAAEPSTPSQSKSSSKRRRLSGSSPRDVANRSNDDDLLIHKNSSPKSLLARMSDSMPTTQTKSEQPSSKSSSEPSVSKKSKKASSTTSSSKNRKPAPSQLTITTSKSALKDIPPSLPSCTATELSMLSESDDKDSSNVCGGINGACHFCGIKKTGQWRRGPAGQRTLCNACGINWTKKVRAESVRSGVTIAEAEKIVGDDSTKFRRNLNSSSTDSPTTANAPALPSPSSKASTTPAKKPSSKSKSLKPKSKKPKPIQQPKDASAASNVSNTKLKDSDAFWEPNDTLEDGSGYDSDTGSQVSSTTKSVGVQLSSSLGADSEGQGVQERSGEGMSGVLVEKDVNVVKHDEEDVQVGKCVEMEM